MTNIRFLVAILLAACALAASVLVAIPVDTDEQAGAGFTASVPVAPTNPRGAAGQVRSNPASGDVSKPPVAAEEAHAEVPRLWLGNPVAR